MENEILLNIINLIKDIRDNQNMLPKLVYAKEIAENYKINLNKATEFCKKYGTNFGGWCIECNKFQEILHNADINLFD